MERGIYHKSSKRDLGLLVFPVFYFLPSDGRYSPKYLEISRPFKYLSGYLYMLIIVVIMVFFQFVVLHLYL